MNARDQARSLRAAGYSVPDIARRTGVARSTAWLWVRDLPLDPERVAEGASRRAAAIRASWARRQEKTARYRLAIHSSADGYRGRLIVTVLRSRDLYRAVEGVVARDCAPGGDIPFAAAPGDWLR